MLINLFADILRYNGRENSALIRFNAFLLQDLFIGIPDVLRNDAVSAAEHQIDPLAAMLRDQVLNQLPRCRTGIQLQERSPFRLQVDGQGRNPALAQRIRQQLRQFVAGQVGIENTSVQIQDVQQAVNRGVPTLQKLHAVQKDTVVRNDVQHIAAHAFQLVMNSADKIIVSFII